MPSAINTDSLVTHKFLFIERFNTLQLLFKHCFGLHFLGKICVKDQRHGSEVDRYEKLHKNFENKSKFSLKNNLDFCLRWVYNIKRFQEV